MHFRRSVLLAVIITIVVLAGGCISSAPSSPVSPAPSQPADQGASSTAPQGAFSIRAASLVPGSVLPDIYTCKGASESPEVTWDGVPAGTKSLALILDDPDAPGGRFTHWLVFNIPPDSRGLPRAQPNAKVLANGAQQGETSGGSRGYYPPCPPIGTSHRYVFRLYAVDMDITQPTADRDSIDWALTDHTIAKTEFTTTFKR
ncbi:MAG TPA: YbhB/YbcL family Raf kinase inhibitor-like protein [Methanoregula sp.]|nr:YbhB/YbcL family Raf kinase inhibitor-like protein [Methanoregula sp.]